MKKFFIKFILGIIAVFILVQIFFLRIYFVSTSSMEPTYKINSVIVATLFDYGRKRLLSHQKPIVAHIRFYCPSGAWRCDSF